MEFSKSEEDKNNKSNVRDHWGNIKHTNITLWGPRKKGVRRTLKMYYRTLWLKMYKPEEGNIIDIQVLEIQRVPDNMNLKRPTSRHTIIKMAKDKERILKTAREK